MDWTDDGDEAFFEWALAHFRHSPVIFPDFPADSVSEKGEDAAARRKRLNRLD